MSCGSSRSASHFAVGCAVAATSMLACGGCVYCNTPGEWRAAGGDETQAEEAATTEWHSRTQESSGRVESELDGWEPPCDEPYEPVEDVRHRDMNIVGSWDVCRVIGGSDLTIMRNNEGGYSVSFSTSGCFDHWRLKRQGEYHDGVLRLNRPVRDYFPLTYDRLYAISVEGTDRLLIGVCLEDIAALLVGETVEGRVGQMFLMYERTAGSPAP